MMFLAAAQMVDPKDREVLVKVLVRLVVAAGGEEGLQEVEDGIERRRSMTIGVTMTKVRSYGRRKRIKRKESPCCCCYLSGLPCQRYCCYSHLYLPCPRCCCCCRYYCRCYCRCCYCRHQVCD